MKENSFHFVRILNVLQLDVVIKRPITSVERKMVVMFLYKVLECLYFDVEMYIKYVEK